MSEVVQGVVVEDVFDRAGVWLQRRLSVGNIQREVCLHFKLDVKHLLSPKRDKRYSVARQIAMYLARELTGRTTPDLGLFFRREHSMVIRSCRLVEERCQTDPEFREKVDYLRQLVKSTYI